MRYRAVKKKQQVKPRTTIGQFIGFRGDFLISHSWYTSIVLPQTIGSSSASCIGQRRVIWNAQEPKPTTIITFYQKNACYTYDLQPFSSQPNPACTNIPSYRQLLFSYQSIITAPACNHDDTNYQGNYSVINHFLFQLDDRTPRIKQLENLKSVFVQVRRSK